MDRLIQQVDRLAEKIDENHVATLGALADIKTVQALQAQQLEEHMRRTAIAEESIEIMKAEMQPIKNHVQSMRRTGRIVGRIWSWLWKLAAAICTAWTVKWLA